MDANLTSVDQIIHNETYSRRLAQGLSASGQPGVGRPARSIPIILVGKLYKV